VLVSQGTVMYVSTDLVTWFPLEPYIFGRDVTILRITYRRLDPAYYAWLRHKMQLAKTALHSGWLAPAAYRLLLERFARVHAWAVANLGRDALRDAVRELVAVRYVGPFDESPTPKAPLPVPDELATSDDSGDGDEPQPVPATQAAINQEVIHHSIAPEERDETAARPQRPGALQTQCSK
jgi:hypothetical protein